MGIAIDDQLRSLHEKKIEEKLRVFLEKKIQIESEPDAVYMMVQLRKLIEQAVSEGDARFPVLKFYCNWTLHSSIHDVKAILEVLKKIDSTNDPAEFGKWISMSYLLNELMAFLEERNIPNGFMKTHEQWFSFCEALGTVLMDQPLKISNSEIGISEIRITRVEQGFMWGRIDYKEGDERNFSHFEFRIRPRED